MSRVMIQRCSYLSILLALACLQGAWLSSCDASVASVARAAPAAAARAKPSVTAAAASQQAGQHHASASQNAIIATTKAESGQQQLVAEGLSIDSIAANATIKAESGQQQLVAEGLSIDSIAAEAAARPAADLPSQYAVTGVIDPQSPQQSEEPGVLVPLAQGHSPVGDWLAAVNTAGPSTPLSDPMFVGTVFIPHNEAFEELYPELRLLKLAGRSSVDFFSNVSTAGLAMQLNCLTVPGAALKLDELWPGRLLRTAGFGALKVISNRAAERPARLQHQPSGVYFSVVEPDLQSGSAVGHVIDVVPPAAVLNKVTVSTTELQDTWQYRSVLMGLTDPVRHLQAFSFLVQRAALTALIESSTDAFTLFAPDDKAMAALMASLSVYMRQQLLTNATLADAFVSSHLVLGTGLGSKALEALGPAGQLRTSQGNLAIGIASEQRPRRQLPPGAVSLVEAGRPSQEDTPAPPSQNASQDAAAAATETVSLPSLAGNDAPPAVPGTLTEPAAAEMAYQPTVADVNVSELVAAGTAAGSPEVAIARSRTLTVADAAVVSNDMVGGRAVLHVVDSVLVSPLLGRELGMRPTPGYAPLEAPPPSAGSSGSQQAGLSHARFAMSVAAAACLLLLL